VRDVGNAHELPAFATRHRSRRGSGARAAAIAAGLLCAALAACASGRDGSERFFQATPADDTFAPLIREWQMGERVEAADAQLERTRGGPPVGEGELASTYRDFSFPVRRKIIDQVVAWVQMQADGLKPSARPAEREGTALAPLLEQGEGRYDGFELLTFSLLRARGFGEGELFRSILRRGRDDVYHRVTLWFAEGQRGDPYVLDPTGWITREVQPISKLAPWQPVRLYDEKRQYSAETQSPQ
jgi:hypothetical protein